MSEESNSKQEQVEVNNGMKMAMAYQYVTAHPEYGSLCVIKFSLIPRILSTLMLISGIGAFASLTIADAIAKGSYIHGMLAVIGCFALDFVWKGFVGYNLVRELSRVRANLWAKNLIGDEAEARNWVATVGQQGVEIILAIDECVVDDENEHAQTIKDGMELLSKSILERRTYEDATDGGDTRLSDENSG